MKRRNLLHRLTAAACTLALLLALVPAARAAEGPMESDNAYLNAYDRFPQSIRSYLYVNAGGGLTRVEYNKFNGKVTVEDYNGVFQLQSRRTIPGELNVWGGFFAGQNYNFLIVGQDNSKQDDSKEAVRVIKYDKDWNRLGHASVSGINTRFPFEAGALRCAESGGMLYIHTSHQMYNGHQSNMNIVIRQSDMAIASTDHDMSSFYGYVSHSFNQYILVDQSGNILTADHGDGYPRAMRIQKVDGVAGTDRMDIGRSGQDLSVQYGSAETERFPGEIGDNVTYASLGGLAETSSGYLIAYAQSAGKGSPYQIKLGYIGKSDFHTHGRYAGGNEPSNTLRVRQITNNTSTAKRDTTPMLAPTGLSGGWVLWNTRDADYSGNVELHYAAYSADGTVGAIQTAANVPLSECQPVIWNGKAVWYVTGDSVPTFYTLDASGVTATPAGGTAATVPAQPATPAQPSAGGKLTIDAMLAPPTFGWNTALKADGTVWAWDNQNPTPVQKSGLTGKSASAYACVKEDGSLWIWGYQAYKDGSSDHSLTPTPVKVMDNVLYAGINDSGFASALKTDGTLWRWGSGKAPGSAVKVLDGVVQTDNPGPGWYALKKDGTLWEGYGYDTDAEQIGSGYKAFSVGDACVYGIKADGSLWGWGNNKTAQLGQGYTSDYVEIPVKIMDGVVAIDGHFAITSDGALYAWGGNNRNQLGFSGGDLQAEQWGKPAPCQSKPRKVMEGVAAVHDSTVLKQDGSLWNLSYNDSTGSYDGFRKILDGVMLPGGDAPSTPAPSTGAQFTDVPAGYWAKTAIDACVSQGIVTGLGNGTFKPDRNISYAEFVSMLTRTFYNSEVEAAKQQPADPVWYYPYIKVLQDQSLDEGTRLSGSGWRTCANNAISRYEMAEMIKNVIKTAGGGAHMPDLFELADAGKNVKDWSQIPIEHGYAVQVCFAAGILTGLSDGTFSGSLPMTRAQACVVIDRLRNFTGG